MLPSKQAEEGFAALEDGTDCVENCMKDVLLPSVRSRLDVGTRRDGAWPCRSKPLDKLERNTKFLRLCQWQRTLRAEAICLTLVAVGRGIATGMDGRSSQKLLHGQRFYCHVTEHKLDHKEHARLCFVVMWQRGGRSLELNDAQAGFNWSIGCIPTIHMHTQISSCARVR